MAFVPVPNAIMAEIRMTLDNQKVENTLYFADPTMDVATAATVAEELIAWWQASYAPLVTAGLALREVVVTDLSSPSGYQITRAPTALSIGEIADSEALPNSISLAVSFRTFSRGRSFRGRNFTVGSVANQLANNTFDENTVNSWRECYQALFPLATDNGCSWVVVSRYSGVDASGNPIPRAAGIYTLITNVVVSDPTVDNQRRRLPGRGN